MHTSCLLHWQICKQTNKMAIVFDVRLKKVNKVYHDGEMISGTVLIQTNSDFKHDGISLSVEGNVNLQLSAKNVGILEAFYQSVKPIQLVNISLEVASPGKIPSGKTEIPFEFQLKPKGNKTLYETYHGVFVNIQYLIKADMKRSFLAKDLIKVCEFIVEYKPDKVIPPQPILFVITPDSLQNVRDRSNIPRFLVKGSFDSTVCDVTKPFTGELVVEQCDVPIKSVELQLVRVETCGCAEGFARDATEIQNIQIGEGDVPTGIVIPVYMILPRLFTCPTLSTSNFKVEFEINVVIIFQDDHLITENFPVVLVRQ